MFPYNLIFMITQNKNTKMKAQSFFKALSSASVIKKTALLSLASVILLGQTGCEKFLEKDPTFIVKENYYNNETDVNIGLAGIYDIMGKEEVYGGALLLDLNVADDGFYSRSAFTIGTAVYNFDASTSTVSNLWRFLYEGIERANVFLSRVDQVQMPEANKAAAKGEAKFLRAYYHFLLVSNWGDIPLKTVPTSSVNDINIKRTPQREVYDFIVKEMEEAEGLVKTATQLGAGGRVSKSAVRGVLARVYLKMAGAPLNDVSKYAEALKWARKIVYPDNGPKEHRLNPDFKQIFINYAADKYDIGESIWEVEFFGNRGGDFEAGRVGNTMGLQCNDEAFGYGYGFINATPKLYARYGATDTRRDWTIAPYQYVYNNVNNLQVVRDSTFWTSAQLYNRNCGKYRRVYEVVKPKNKNYTPMNFPLLRYADVLLMLAEAENEVNGPTSVATAALKEVRDRASATDVTSLATSKEELRRLIREERFLELAFEGIRKFDLIRWDVFTSEMNQLARDIQNTAPTTFRFAALAGTNVTLRHNLLPIPVLELSLNNGMTQNQGW
ncbi:starch-binding protein SusD [Pedobacter glucosidilyticus]|nr:starch-binding protein SusD [Pedobacter glucosidilyticus]